MITPEQTREIREYLLSKRLPIDILMEVEDHFVNQITELQQQDLGFSEALQKDSKMVKIIGSGLKESHPHDVIITQEAPNYSL